MSNFIPHKKLKSYGFKDIGEDVYVSETAIFHSPEKISIGSHVRIDDYSVLSGDITIGDYVHIAPYVGLFGSHGISVGNYVNISSKCTIYSTSDDYSGDYLTGPMVDESFIHDIGRNIIIEDHVIIGTGSSILPGAKLLQGTAIGAMSMVKNEVGPWKIYFGVPCKLYKERSRKAFDELIVRNLCNQGGVNCKLFHTAFMQRKAA